MLRAIMARKRDEVGARKAAKPLEALQKRAADAPTPRGFRNALAHGAATHGLALIAEIKKASPSKGLIRADFDPPAHARAYAHGGAACLSVLTDKPGFQGDDAHLTAARAAVDLPILRKDFVWEPYQVWEARALGADAVLLILAVLDDDRAAALAACANDLGLDVLAEVHTEAELARAAKLGFTLIGVNNRDLNRFITDLATFERLAPHAPKGAVLVAESGVASPEDGARMGAAGAAALLVGESLMRADDPGAAAAALLNGARARLTKDPLDAVREQP